VKHLSDEQLSAYLDGALTGRAAQDAARHIEGCQPCREALAELAAQDESLAPLLTHDPGDEYFDTFAARVEDRIRAAGLAGAAARVEGFDWGRWFRSPRTLAWTGAVAVLVVGGGLALMTSREGISPTQRYRKLDEMIGSSAPPANDRDLAVPPPSAPSATPPAGEKTMVPPPAALQKEQASQSGAGALEAEGQAVPPAEGEFRSKADADARQAAPSRAMEVRRTESGEEVAVKRKDMPSLAPGPAPQVAGSTAGGAKTETQVHKPTQAGLMKQSAAPAAPPAATPAPQATALDAAPPAGARNQGFAEPPPQAKSQEKLGVTSRAEPGDVRVCGSVLDSRGRPISGAQVVASDLGRGTTADGAGRFCLSLPPGEHPLSVMAVGYMAGRRTLAAAEREVQITLAAVPVLEGDGAMAYTQTRRLTNPSRDALAALPDSLRGAVAEAQRLESAALANRTAAAFDAAAGAWERSLRPLIGGPLEIEARRHLAAARYRAWELAPTSARARAATEALTAYVSRAPAGPDRTQASAWLDHVRP
jgi:hypothetical protein